MGESKYNYIIFALVLLFGIVAFLIMSNKSTTTTVNVTAGTSSYTPSATVTWESAWGQAANVGASTVTFSRGDHTHGTPTDPITAHVAEADAHTQYQKESEKGAANGYASLGAGGLVPTGQLGTGADTTNYLRGDGTYATPPGLALAQQPLYTAATGTFNFGNGNIQLLTLTGSPNTLTFSGATSGWTLKLFVAQDNVGARLATWSGNWKWPGGVQPVLSSTAYATDIFTFSSDGTSLFNTGMAVDVK